MEITVNVEHGAESIGALDIENLARFVALREGKPESTEVSITFVDDDRIAELNESYRGKVGPTDVLSFELDGFDDDFDDETTGVEQDAPFLLGDIVIAVDVASRQCESYGCTLEEEIELLVVHGMLHLCGYDHIIEEEAQVMEAREDELLEAWRSR